jgi:NADP-dependent 3-hydroxy acid dehydrogenase YdfG
MNSVTDRSPALANQLLQGRVAVVTGAASGIGSAIAEGLAAAGAHVALLARRGDRLLELAERIRAGGGIALALPADVTEPARLAEAAEGIRSELGTVDVLINNAGIMLPGPITDQPVAEWQRMIDTNLAGALNTIRAFIPDLLIAAAHDGVADLVNISSIGGKVAFPTYSVYGATKAALTQLSAVLRAELGGRDIRVTDLQPGLTESELADNVTDPDARAGLSDMFQAIPALKPADIADIVTHLVSRPAHVSVPTLDIVPTRQT